MNKKERNPTIVGGLLLIAVGILGRLLTGTTSLTALIPAFFGLPIAVLGWVAANSNRQRSTLVAVILLALLGVLGSINVLGDIVGGEASAASLLSRGGMLILCAFILYASVTALIAAQHAYRSNG